MRIAFGLVQGGAGLLGAAGVGLAAAAAHKGGGNFGAMAATFMLLHAAALLGVSVTAWQQPKAAWGLLIAALSMLVGTVLFSGDLALLGFVGTSPWPQAAPTGGVMLIGGWLIASASWTVAALRNR